MDLEGIPIITGVFAACIQEHTFNIDCDEEENLLIFQRCLKYSSPRSRSTVLRWLFVQMREKQRHHREVLGGFASMVLRYADVQFAEDFRMSRQRFRVY